MVGWCSMGTFNDPCSIPKKNWDGYRMVLFWFWNHVVFLGIILYFLVRFRRSDSEWLIISDHTESYWSPEWTCIKLMHQINQIASIWLLDVIGYIWLYLVMIAIQQKLGALGTLNFRFWEVMCRRRETLREANFDDVCHGIWWIFEAQIYDV